VLLAGTGVGQVPAPRQVARSTRLIKVSQGDPKEILGQLDSTADWNAKAAQDVFGWNKAIPLTYAIVSADVIKLTADLPSEVASEVAAFWNAVGENLGKAVEQTYKERADRIRTQLEQVERQKAEALAKLQGPASEDPGARAIREQLQKEADLAALRADMPLADAIERVRTAGTPPLRIVVLWNDLKGHGVEPNTPIGMDGVNPMRLETALQLLVKAVGSSSHLDYALDNGVITIASGQTLQSLNRDAPTDPEAGASSEQLAAKQFSLNNLLETAQMELAVLQARRQAIEQQIVELNKRIDERIAANRLLGDLQRLVAIRTDTESNVKVMYQAGPAADQAGEEALERAVNTQIEFAQQKEGVSQAAGGALLTKYLSELSEISVQQAEIEARLAVARDQLRKTEAALAQAPAAMVQKVERDLTMKSLQEMEERIFNLRQGRTNLQTPVITILAEEG